MSAQAILFPGLAEDHVGVHLLEVRSYVVAERWFRQAISLNPTEPHFKVHLAHSLYQQCRYQEAIDLLHAVLRAVPAFAPAVRLLEWCTGRLKDLREQQDTKEGTGVTEG
jgi:cytochrome c-type biogenesis protein CcmH/NrfG